MLEAAAILSGDGVIEPGHLPLVAKVEAPPSLHDLDAMERQTIERVLRQTDWNKPRR